MKHAIEIDMSDGPVPIAALQRAINATSRSNDATVIVTQKPTHLVFPRDSFGAVPSIVLRIEWDDEAV